ncbi:MAG: diguanylate cyclase [Bacteroidales bacterium]|nr:diguanylate cyclase [Bacteroidales bacterium]MCM1417132.1 diguanylate cyclase [bacterium]MCM1423055.1 diguanylate cyclase [bacterium]
MRQTQFAYRNKESFREELSVFARDHAAADGPRLFQIYSEVLDPAVIREVTDAIEACFPDTPYIGCSTSGNIIDCELSENITVVCTDFELPTTKVEIFQYDMAKLSVDEITAQIVEETRKNPWVKAVEMYFTIPEGSTTRFCDGMKDLREDIQVFGGVTCSDDITSDDSCVFTKAYGFSETSIVIVFYGGEDFYVDSIKVTGWKPLGRKFHVTKSQGSLLQELDGISAYEVYRKYLNIKNDENFFYNTLEFPLFYEHNDTTILRTPVSSNADGSINMTSDMDIGSVVRISYGDPGTIVESIREDSRRIADFAPDVLHIFSCAARRTFWTNKEPTYEIQPFHDICASCGFFSHGEFLRTKGNLNQHNVTLVIAAMREGEKKESVRLPETSADNMLSRVPLVSRLATFISVTSLELEKMNQQLALVNDKLKEAAIIDGLTGLYNRKEIQRQIEEALSGISGERFSLVMLDIDNFKQVNDTYGHQEGDAVIIGLADILRNKRGGQMQNVAAGRWGGEEFMVLLHGSEASSAAYIADLMRECFANTNFPGIRPQTVSLGVTQARADDTVDSLCSRVDMALYKAKKGGKNRVEIE